MGSPVRRLLPFGGVGVGGYAALQWLGRCYGATPAERRQPLPGDDLCPAPQVRTTHAITLSVPPEQVWPWLVQMGWGRGQWYTARWVDRLLFPGNGPSADRIEPELQHLAVGDRILDGPPEAKCSFLVERLEPARHLVLHSVGHLPPGWAERFGATIDFTWAFILEPLPGGRTRFVFRSRAKLGPAWVRRLYQMATVPADFDLLRFGGPRDRALGTSAAVLDSLGRRRQGGPCERLGLRGLLGVCAAPAPVPALPLGAGR